jgi:hypothetical protein
MCSGRRLHAAAAAHEVQQSDVVEFSERTLEGQDLHEAFLQSRGACRPVADKRPRAKVHPERRR